MTVPRGEMQHRMEHTFTAATIPDDLMSENIKNGVDPLFAYFRMIFLGYASRSSRRFICGLSRLRSLQQNHFGALSPLSRVGSPLDVASSPRSCASSKRSRPPSSSSEFDRVRRGRAPDRGPPRSTSGGEGGRNLFTWWVGLGGMTWCALSPFWKWKNTLFHVVLRSL